jgi:hypothetical protein
MVLPQGFVDGERGGAGNAPRALGMPAESSQPQEIKAAILRQSCTNPDTLWSKDASTLIQERIVEDLRASGLFPEVKTISTGPDDLMMKQTYMNPSRPSGETRWNPYGRLGR